MKKKLVFPLVKKGDTLTVEPIDLLQGCSVEYDETNNQCIVYIDLTESTYKSLQPYIIHEEDVSDEEFYAKFEMPAPVA